MNIKKKTASKLCYMVFLCEKISTYSADGDLLK